jgi:hypothetical protein
MRVGDVDGACLACLDAFKRTVGVGPNFRQIEFRHWHPRTAWPSRGRFPEKVVIIEGEKAAIPTTGRKMPGIVIFPHRYHPMPEGKEFFL